MDTKSAAIQIRNLLSEESPALVGLPLPRIQAILATALENYARSAFHDARKRQNFKQRIEATVSAGEVDLTDYVDGTESRIYLPDLPKTTVYLSSDNQPFVWVGQREMLYYNRLGSSDSPACFLDGQTLYTHNHADGETDSLDEDIYFTIPVYPETVSDLPLTLEKDFIIYAAEFVRSQLVPVQAN